MVQGVLAARPRTGCAKALTFSRRWISEPARQRSLSVGLLGPPNVGKSTLMNALVGQKVSIATSKAQTTRHETLGIVTAGNTQLLFYDTPGILHPTKMRRRMTREMSTSGLDTALGVDLVAVMVDATRPVREQYNALFVLDRLDFHGIKPEQRVLVLNKVDGVRGGVKSPRLMLLALDISSQFRCMHTFPVSALHGRGTDDFRNHLIALAQPRPWAYDASQSTDMNPQQFAEEIIREKLWQNLNQVSHYPRSSRCIPGV